MAIARLEFFVRLRYWLISGGITTLKAWGKITNRNACSGFNPIDLAASTCPFHTACIPARTISEIKAPV